LNFYDNPEDLFAMGVRAIGECARCSSHRVAMGVSISHGEGLERMMFKHLNFSFDVARNDFHCSIIERVV
jgi:hypothetical protein